MSVNVSSYYWDQVTAIRGNDRLVIMALAEYANESGWCYPSIAEIARRCQLTSRGTQKIIDRLAADGHIAVEPNQGTRKTSGSPTNRYHLLAYQRSLNAAKGEPMRSPLPDQKDEQTSSPLATPKDEPIRSPFAPEKGEQIAAKGEQACSPDPYGSVKEPENATRRACATPAAAAAPAQPAKTQNPPEAYQAVIKVYEQEIGLATPIVSNDIKDALRLYPAAWLTEAISIAVRRNNRRWSYAAGVLRRWARDGYDGGQDNLSAQPRTATPSKSLGYGRQATPAKENRTDEYANDPEYLKFLASFVDAPDAARSAAD